MNYKETIDYLYKQLPMFHRVGAAAYKADLKNIQALTEHLGHPENKTPAVHIAGTNGKGSVSNMLASVLQEAGYKTGLFTSPHLIDFRERIRVNGAMIREDQVIHFVEENKKRFEEIAPSFFEWTTALAFHHFAMEKADVAIIETGLGGRLDSTNIITPVLSVITNISYDHMQFLGNTLEKIAAEKAGIIKTGIPIVIGERQQECDFVFINRAKELNSELVFASDHYRADFRGTFAEGQYFKILKENETVFDNLLVWLKGKYQSKNVCTTLHALELLKKTFSRIENKCIVSGLKNIFINTGFQGRWQILGQHPLIIADIGHNEAGIQSVTEQLAELKCNKLRIVFGMVNDKDVSSVLSLMPKNAQYYFCKANLPRAMDAAELKSISSEYGLLGKTYSSVTEAFLAAKGESEESDVIFIGGSTFVVAEVLLGISKYHSC
jgi:dihydrofolate synthase/folylpolyglutamate synthase